MLDPNPKIWNQGASKLRKAGVNVYHFPLELRKEIQYDNANFIRQFEANPHAQGTVSFDYTHNDGKFVIGQGDYLFETKWGGADSANVWVYKHNLKGLAVADNAERLVDIPDASIFNMTSPTKGAKKDKIVILENINGYYAAILIMEVKDKTRSDAQNELMFQFWILTDKSRDFSKL